MTFDQELRDNFLLARKMFEGIADFRINARKCPVNIRARAPEGQTRPRRIPETLMRKLVLEIANLMKRNVARRLRGATQPLQKQLAERRDDRSGH